MPGWQAAGQCLDEFLREIRANVETAEVAAMVPILITQAAAKDVRGVGWREGRGRGDHDFLPWLLRLTGLTCLLSPPQPHPITITITTSGRSG